MLKQNQTGMRYPNTLQIESLLVPLGSVTCQKSNIVQEVEDRINKANGLAIGAAAFNAKTNLARVTC